MPDANRSTPVPVNILTGFLGAGKNTLLKRFLSEEHGQRIAAIENECCQIDEVRQPVLIFIGRNLPKQAIHEALDSCRVLTC